MYKTTDYSNDILIAVPGKKWRFAHDHSVGSFSACIFQNDMKCELGSVAVLGGHIFVVILRCAKVARHISHDAYRAVLFPPRALFGQAARKK